jgi:hypothetical protein
MGVEKSTMNNSPAQKAPRDYLSFLFWVVLLIFPVVAYWMAHKPSYETIPVLQHDVPAYRMIVAGDISRASILTNEIASDAIRDDSALLNHYTRVAVRRGEPLRKDQIVAVEDQQFDQKTITVMIPMSRITVLSDSLNSGDIVNVSAVETGKDPVLILDAVLVLDVRSDQTVVLAIPENRWGDYLKNARVTSLLMAKRTK